MTFPAIKSFHASRLVKQHLFLTLAEKATLLYHARKYWLLLKELGSKMETNCSLSKLRRAASFKK